MSRKKDDPQPTPDPAPEQPARRHAPDAGVKEYGVSLDEISRRSHGR